MTKTTPEDVLRNTAPRGTRDISLRIAENTAGYMLTFISPYHDVPVSILVDYKTVAKRNFSTEWWNRIIDPIRKKNEFEFARKRYLDYEDFKAGSHLLHCVVYWGMKTRPELFNDNGAFTLDTLPNGNLKIGDYEINGPEARHAMTIPLETPITDHFQHTYTHGDPEIMTNLWRNVK